jgi:hypothetical protein
MSTAGTLGYDSPYEAVPLTELEEALLLVAGTGLTGLNLGDIDPSMGADAQSRTAGSGRALYEAATPVVGGRGMGPTPLVEPEP